MFKIIKPNKNNSVRRGELTLNNLVVPTPLFMPVATRGVVKHVSAEEISRLGFGLLLSNTYHLMLRPSEAQIKKAGGLAKWSGWQGATLTDSGGFQIFSLAGRKGDDLVKVSEAGVVFRSHLDGSRHELTPESAVRIQRDLGVDIAVCLDECMALPASRDQIRLAMELTSRWAQRAKIYHQKLRGRKPFLFAVIQGGLDKALRLQSLAELIALDFDGYNIGGLSVGESPRQMYQVLDYLTPLMPADKPRYLMGVGYPDNIVEAVKRGVDMFDCVIPSREGRHGRLFVWNQNGRKLVAQFLTEPKTKLGQFFQAVNVSNAKLINHRQPINPESIFSELRTCTWSYLNYLFKIDEPLGQRLASLNNLEFYSEMMRTIRSSIAK